MKFQYFFGPDRIPFVLSDHGQVEAQALPFHGIISRGLLNRLMDSHADNALWRDCAHLLDAPAAPAADGRLQSLRDMARLSGVLTYAQSAWCATLYVQRTFEGADRQDWQASLWNVKEGHTSSVWQVHITQGPQHNAVATFAVNAGRDREASEELRQTSTKLKTVGDQLPGLSMAKVLDIAEVSDERLPGTVVVTRNEWVDHAFEIHARRDRTTEAEQLLIVERFLTGKQGPTQITSVLGRACSWRESKTIRRTVRNFIQRASTVLPEALQVNITDGDVVWNGKRAVVVAIS